MVTLRAVHEDPQGAPLSVGRKRRSIPASLKRALLRRDEHCRFPGCENRVFLDGHHFCEVFEPRASWRWPHCEQASETRKRIVGGMARSG